MGSANLNDRSMWGSRDSELAVFIDGQHDHAILVNSKIYRVNKKVHEFRVKLFEEHFGLPSTELLFPSSNYFWAQAWNIARINTKVYESVFQVYPSSTYTNWAKLKERAKIEKTFKAKYEEELLYIKFG